MPRRLSNYEWAAFLQSVPICPFDQSQEAKVEQYCSSNVMVIPPWGAVVEWGGMDVLVFLGAPRDIPEVGVFDAREVYLTDITDLCNTDPRFMGPSGLCWKDQITPQYSAWADVFWYSLPQNIYTVLRDEALPYAENVMVESARLVGQIAGGITGPTLQPLAVPLALIGVALLFIYLPRR